jgi:hypothetical protein
MVAGFLLLVLSAIALPSAGPAARGVVVVFAALSAALILVGVALAARKVGGDHHRVGDEWMRR